MPELRVAELESLDPALDLFRASPAPAAELVEHGLHPPLPVCGRYLAWGFALLAAAREAGKAGLECRLLGERTPAQMLALALRLEGRPGAYRWSEKLAIERYARSRGLDIGELAELIEGRPDPRLGEKLGQFASLSPALAAQVEDGGLDLRTAFGVRGLPEEAITATAPLTFSERRSFLGLLRDARLDREGALAAARAALAGSRPVEALRELASPTLAALRREWAALEESLLAGSGVTLKPPDFFEGDLFEARFSFRSKQGLARRLSALAALEARFDELDSFVR